MDEKFLAELNFGAVRQRSSLWYLRNMASGPDIADIRWIIDLRTRAVRECTPQAAALWGYTQEEMVGIDADCLIHADEVERARQLRDEHVSGDAGIWKCIRKDGSMFLLHISVQKGVRHGRLCSFVEAVGAPGRP